MENLMGRMQREKGKRGEREVAAVYVSEGVRVTRLGNAGRLADLSGLDKLGVHAEVKMTGRTDLPGWMRQAEAEAPATQIPAVHWRLCSRGVSTGWYVNVPLSDFIDLLKEARGL
jgi:hypothetical protein